MLRILKKYLQGGAKKIAEMWPPTKNVIDLCMKTQSSGDPYLVLTWTGRTLRGIVLQSFGQRLP